MKLENFNNKFVKITDIDDQTFVGICLFNHKEVYDEEYLSKQEIDGLDYSIMKS